MGYLAIIGTALSAFGQVKGGQDAAAVYEYNQQLAKYRKDYAKDKADIELAGLERDVAAFTSRQRAIAGASGGETGTGSNLDSLLRTQREADIDAALIRYNADIEAWMAGNEANLLSTQASQIKSGAYLWAGATILGGASKWDWKKSQLRGPYYPSRPASSSRFGVRPGV